MVFDSAALVPQARSNLLRSTAEPLDGGRAFSEQILINASRTPGDLKFWDMFVDWARRHDVALVVGAYAFRDKYYGKRELVFATRDSSKIVVFDRVPKSGASLEKMQSLKEYTRALAEGETPLPSFEEGSNSAQARVVPEHWFPEGSSVYVAM